MMMLDSGLLFLVTLYIC